MLSCCLCDHRQVGGEDLPSCITCQGKGISRSTGNDDLAIPLECDSPPNVLAAGKIGHHDATVTESLIRSPISLISDKREVPSPFAEGGHTKPATRIFPPG